MAVVAGRQRARRVTAPDERLAALAQRRRPAGAGGGGYGRSSAGEVLGDLAQVGVVEEREQVVHQLVVAPAVAEIAQLVEQVAGRLAGDARVVAVGRGSAFLAVAAGAGEHALGDRVLEPRSIGAGSERDACHGDAGERDRPLEDRGGASPG